jgi:hypothetical protein
LSENELGNNKATLYLDSAPCHLTAPVKDTSKQPASANPSGVRRGRKPYPIDANGNKIRPEKENKATGQKQNKSKK